MAISLIAFRMRWTSAAAVLGALVLAMAVAVAVGTAAPAGSSSAPVALPAPGKIGSSLADLFADKPDKRVEVIVRMASGQSAESGRALVADHDGRPISRNLSIINGFGASMTAEQAVRLADNPRVKAVSLNGDVRVKNVLPGLDDTEFSCPASDATTRRTSYPTSSGRDAGVGTALREIGGVQLHSLKVGESWSSATGRGVGVAVVDTGIAGDLPDFRATRSSSESRVVASAVTNPCAKDSTDNYGHGTHVAGLIAGNSLMRREGDANYGRYMGVAPHANLISVKVADEDGATTVLDVIFGLQFVVDHKAAHNIRVVNLSLSSTVAESYLTDPLDAAAEQAWLKGIVVVAAAGNEGSAPDAVSYSPGNDPRVISVGAVDDQGTRTIEDDKLADWSSRGVTQDGFRKPEVLAPGARLASTLAPNSDFSSICPGCVTRSDYFQVGGTSMATALVSGVAALLVEAHPDWTPDQVKGALQSTLRDVPGAGKEVDAFQALRATNLSANAGIPTNGLIDSVSGEIDWARASFRRASFRDAGGSALDASWSRASFRCDCGLLSSGAIDPSRASFRRASFRKTIGFHK